MIVYGVKNKKTSEIVYIGQTIRSLSYRWNQHVRDSKKQEYPLYRAIRKYGVDRFEPFIVETASDRESLNKKEIELIQEYNTLTPNGYNLMLGGKGGEHSEETVEKIKVAAIENGFGKWKRTEKHNEANRAKAFKQFANPEQRLNHLLANGSKEFNVYRAIQVQSKAPGRPSLYDKGEFVGSWLCLTDCAKELNISDRHIWNVLNGKRKVHKGLIFEYKRN